MVTLLKSQAIFDVDTQTTFAGSIAVDGQKITAVYREPVDEAAFDLVRNFGDQMILPGFVDAHQQQLIQQKLFVYQHQRLLDFLTKLPLFSSVSHCHFGF